MLSNVILDIKLPLYNLQHYSTTYPVLNLIILHLVFLAKAELKPIFLFD